MDHTSGKPSTSLRSRNSQEAVHGAGSIIEHLAPLEALNLPVSLINRQYVYEWVNGCFGATQGKRPFDLIGSPVTAIWGQKPFDRVIKDRLDRCFEGEEVRDEAWISFPALGRRYCEVVYSPYCPYGEGLMFALVVTYDVTERKTMEEALEHSELRFKKLSEASLEAIVFIEDGVVVDSNAALSNLFNYEEAEVRGKLATDFIAPEQRELAGQRVRERLEGIYETLGLRKHGTTFPIEVQARELEENGRHFRISAVRDLTERKRIEKQLEVYRQHLEKLVEERTRELARTNELLRLDIIERKRAEALLRESEEKYRTIYENIAEGIFRITPDGRCVDANPAMARMHGYDSPRELMQHITDIGRQIHKDPKRRPQYMALLHATGSVRDFEFQIYKKDGTPAWVSVNARAIRSKHGEVLYHEGTVQDITDRKRAEEQMLTQCDLALKLAGTLSLGEALTLCLKTAMKLSGMECGGIYLKNRTTEDLELIASVGLAPDFERKVSLVKAQTDVWLLVMLGEPVYIIPDISLTPELLQEGFTSLAVIPILYNGHGIACINVASRTLEAVPLHARALLELIAAQLGNIITRLQAEAALEVKSRNLEELNTALRVLLKCREEDKKELEERVLVNAKKLVLPYVRSLKKTRLSPDQQTLVRVVEERVQELISPFLQRMEAFDFTPRELEVISLIKEGRTTKEIAELLNACTGAIDMRRNRIRRKLKMTGKKVNLGSYLLSLE